jgi:signal transduction histidine kinase
MERILDALPVGVWVGRFPTGDVVYANPEFGKIMGMDAAPGVPIEGAPAAYGIFDRAGRPYPVDQLPFSRVAASGQPVVVDDIVVHRPDGRRVNIRAFAHPVLRPDGAIESIAVAFVDITAEVKASVERDQMGARLAFAVNHAPIVIWTADRRGVVTLSEGAGLASLGVRSGQLLGVDLFEASKGHPEISGFLRRGLAGESLWYTVRIGDAVYDTWLTPIRDAAGDVAGLAGLSHDVTELRNLQGRVIQDDRAIALGTLASSIAHEINNPLTYMLGHLERLGRSLDALAEVSDVPPELLGRMRQSLEPVREGTERVASITRELRTFNRPLDDRPVPVDARAVSESVLKLIRKRAEARAVLELDLRPVPAVLGDPARLGQVVLNLLVNALQALPVGGDHRIGLRTGSGPDGVFIEVSDTGPGVPVSERERIFEPFVTTKKIGEGSGLGLFVCRNLVKGMGGRITVEDAPGGGARFRVILPAAPAANPPAAAPSAAPVRGNGHVLLIDDDPEVRKALGCLLEEAGFRVTLEGDVRRAEERLAGADCDVDLAWCDLMMPGRTGMDLEAALRSRTPERLDRLHFMTGGAFTPAAAAFREAHPGRVLDKPFDIAAETAKRMKR